MPSIRIKSYRFVFPTILSVIFMASTVQAQNKTQIAEACIQASEAGDTDTATMLAAQIMDWGTLFGPNIIKKAEQCLQTATGEYWKYFTTKGRFLSDDEARAEQAFIDAAGDRKETQKKNRERLFCEWEIAEANLRVLEEEFKSIKEARAVEALRATLNTCTNLYETDQGTALLNPVCNDVFQNVGIPDTEYAFDYGKLAIARLELAVLTIKLYSRNTRVKEQINECQ